MGRRGERWKSEVGVNLSPHIYKAVKESKRKPKSLRWWCKSLNIALSKHRVTWISVLVANVIYRASSRLRADSKSYTVLE